MSGVGRVWGFLRDGFAGSQVGHRASLCEISESTGILACKAAKQRTHKLPNSGRKGSAASIGVTMPPY